MSPLTPHPPLPSAGSLTRLMPRFATMAVRTGAVGRTGLDIDKLTATAHSLAAQLLPGT
jgi:hypothetical protein